MRTLPVVFDSDIVITHLPEDSHTKRDLTAFERMVSRKVWISSRLHNIYAKELFVSGEADDFERAIPFFEESFQDENRAQDEKLEAVCVLAKAYRMLHRDAKFLKYVFSEVGICAEICYEIGQFFYENGEYQESMRWFTVASNTQPLLNIKYGGEFANEGIENCRMKLGKNIQ